MLRWLSPETTASGDSLWLLLAGKIMRGRYAG